MEIRKATRQKSKLRLGISGPSGSGKTYSALMLASGMTDWENIIVIDTENGSADLYEHLGDFKVLTLNAPYSPERYIKAIQACEEAGAEVIIIDSVSHEWEGDGGILQINEKVAQTKFKGNTWAAWSQTTPRHQAFLSAIVNSDCHIITTARAKVDMVQTEGGKVKKVGNKEIQREGYEYELTLNFTLDRDEHLASASKDRTELFEGLDPFLVTPDTGAALKKWCENGKAPIKKKAVKKQEVKPSEEERPHFQKLRKELQKRGAKNPSQALKLLNELAGTEFKKFSTLSEEDASKAMGDILVAEMGKPKKSPKSE